MPLLCLDAESYTIEKRIGEDGGVISYKGCKIEFPKHCVKENITITCTIHEPREMMRIICEVKN